MSQLWVYLSGASDLDWSSAFGPGHLTWTRTNDLGPGHPTGGMLHVTSVWYVPHMSCGDTSDAFLEGGKLAQSVRIFDLAVIYGANHLVTATCVLKSLKLRKNSQIYFLLGKCSFQWARRSPRRIKFRLKIEGEIPRFTTRFAQYKGVYIELIAANQMHLQTLQECVCAIILCGTDFRIFPPSDLIIWCCGLLRACDR